MRVLLFILAMLPGLARADDTRVQLYAPPALVDSGLMRHILPRFSLKTQVGVDLVDPAAADLLLGSEGRALFSGLGQIWHMEQHSDAPKVQRFADWLTSDVGRRTVLSFAPEGTPLFTEPVVQNRVEAKIEMTGDATLGKTVSRRRCGRCHVTEQERGMSGIGSAPSFAVMRSFADWDSRFSAFFALKPHPAFTQVEGVTDPFPPELPPAIAPIELTLEELEAIVAYVAALPPADLGKPLEHQ